MNGFFFFCLNIFWDAFCSAASTYGTKTYVCVTGHCIDIINIRLLSSFISPISLVRYLTLIWFSMNFCRLLSREFLAASLFFMRFCAYVSSNPGSDCWSAGTERRFFWTMRGGLRLSKYRCRNARNSGVR